MIQKKWYKGKKYGRKILITALVLTTITANYKHMHKPEPQIAYVQHVVSQGETIWDIAKKYNVYDNIDKTVYEIRKINNNSNCIIYPNQVLLVPNTINN